MQTKKISMRLALRRSIFDAVAILGVRRPAAVGRSAMLAVQDWRLTERWSADEGGSLEMDAPFKKAQVVISSYPVIADAEFFLACLLPKLVARPCW